MFNSMILIRCYYLVSKIYYEMALLWNSLIVYEFWRLLKNNFLWFTKIVELDKKGKDVEAVLKMAHNNNNLFSTEKLQLSTDLLDWFLTFCFRDQKLHRHQRRYRMRPTQPWGRLKNIFLGVRGKTKYSSKTLCTHSKWANEQTLKRHSLLFFTFSPALLVSIPSPKYQSKMTNPLFFQ